MSAQPVLPQIWSTDELKAARAAAEARSILDRRGVGPDAFYETCRTVERDVREALAATNNLANVTGESFRANTELWQVLRYFCAPPISEEDLWTLVERKFRRVPPAAADRVAETFMGLFDRLRFPWLDTERAPRDDELRAAISGTVTLLAHERLKTQNRRASSKAQEATVSAALISAGWTLHPDRNPIMILDMLPRGSFSRERKVDGAKCDIPVRLHDGRLLALECKVSNGPKNSWKRLAREVGGKSEQWKAVFGSQVVTGAVLSGVYDLKNLLTAQNEQRVFLFWEHDLRSLIEFVTVAK
jgi:hypothetical protein